MIILKILKTKKLRNDPNSVESGVVEEISLEVKNTISKERLKELYSQYFSNDNNDSLNSLTSMVEEIKNVLSYLRRASFKYRTTRKNKKLAKSKKC